jgi:cell division protein FtsL
MTAGVLPRLVRTRRVAAGRRPVLRPLVVFTLVVVVVFFGMIYSRISLDRMAFEQYNLEQAAAEQERLHWDLRLELARLQDPVRITEAAADLGLVYPDERITIEAPGVATEVTEGTARWTASQALLAELP